MIVAVIIIEIIILILMYYHGEGIPVFLYHEVRNDSGTSPELLSQEFEYLAKKKITTYTLPEAKKILDTKGKLPRNTVLLTFDDGYKDNFENMYPLLKKYQLKATIFVNTAYVEKNDDYLTWNMMNEMSDLVAIETHTTRHNRNFSEIQLEGFFNKETSFKHGSDKIYGRLKPVEGFPVFKQSGEVTSRKVMIKEQFYKKFKLFYEHDIIKINDQNKKIECGQNYIINDLQNDFYTETDVEFEKRVRIDIKNNKAVIDKQLEKKSEFFAWPWGEYSKKTLPWIEKEGIKGFATCIRGTNKRRLNLKWIRRNSIQNATLFKFELRFFITRNLILGKIYEKLSTKNINWEVKSDI